MAFSGSLRSDLSPHTSLIKSERSEIYAMMQLTWMVEPMTNPKPSAVDYLRAYRSEIEEVHQDALQQGAPDWVVLVLDTLNSWVMPTVRLICSSEINRKVQECREDGDYPVVVTGVDRTDVDEAFMGHISVGPIPKRDDGSRTVVIVAPHDKWVVSVPVPAEAS
jgi:hypothetical protein